MIDILKGKLCWVALALLVTCGRIASAQEALDRLVPETDPAVRAALELPRTEPQHYLGAVLALVDLGRPELAGPILAELAGLNLNDDERADLVIEFGSHRMLQLALAAEPGPVGRQFAESCMAAAAARARDPQHMAQLTEQLGDASRAVRRSALVELAAAGQPGAVALLEALAREPDPLRRRKLAAAAVHLDPLSVGPLVAMLSTNDAALRTTVSETLQTLRVAQAMPLVAAAKAPDAANTERLLVDAIRRAQLGTPPFAPDEESQIELWRWDDATKKLGSARYPAEEAGSIWAARLALELVNVRPANADYQRQALVLGLEAAGLLRDPDSAEGEPSAVEMLAFAADGARLSAVLADALEHHYTHAAVAAADLLGRSADASVLYAASPRPAPLAEALDYPHRGVRFAALRAIMALDPEKPFAGASRVPPTLGYFATSASESRAIVAMGVPDQATTLAGRLTAAGIETTAANRGAPAVRAAQQSADLELILVDVDIEGPGIRDVLFALRSNPATGRVPIGLLATSKRLDTARQLATEHSRAIAFPRPQSDAAVVDVVARLGELTSRHRVTADQRAAMAGQTLEWLGTLLARERTFYDLRREAPVIEAALYLPALTERALAALAVVGTPASQRSLVDFASRLSLPIESRRRAAGAFAKSVRRHGILLTEDEIFRQYDRYNASAASDADTQQVLGAVLDTIESLRAQADARQLTGAQTAR